MSAWTAKKRRQTACRDERGQSLVFVVLLLVVMLSIASLVIDIGYARSVRAKAQVAADAAAASGADDLPIPLNVVSDARTMATLNGFTSGGSVTVTINYPPLSGSHMGDVRSVEVVITRQVNTFLAPVIGRNTITATARSVATANGTGVPCVLCVMSSSAARAFTATGATVSNITGGGIVVNSSAADAAYLTGSASITATTIGVVGRAFTSGTAAFHPAASTGITPIVDPLAGVVPPALGGSNLGSVTLTNAARQTVNPGIYTTLSAVGNSALTLNPGTYVVTGGITISNSSSITASGATIYFACSAYPTPCRPGQVGAAFNLNGNGTYNVTAPTTGTYQGLTIFYDRNNAAPLLITNSGHNNYTGTTYALSAAMTISGGTVSDQMDSIIVANTLTLAGSGTVNINFHAGNNYAVSPPPGSSSLTE